MKTLKESIFIGLIITLGSTSIVSCGSEIAEKKARVYCDCIKEANGEMTQMSECLKIIDSAKVEFENTPRHWVKFQEALDDCQN